MRTGVYGGTFNPIHRGHVHILREFIKRLDLRRVLLIPDGTPPHKRAEDLAPPEDRVEMCRLAVQELDIVEISQMELARPGKSFTSDTLTELHGLYPRDELYFLMGEDMFLTVDKWHDAPTIFRLAVLCASPRSPEGYKRLLEKEKELIGLGARCRVVDIPFLDASSTRVRELARAGRDISGLVPEEVAGYISGNRIYGGAEI
ncbi:nicotinate (nicotinamide) nucleotide adenylyltransferase [Acutalibacter muris]|uniref:Probable nicotinate-nucleotide adenylyltransferase n=1 Tax=Acutalibacter muris TaxID=1796620 RepID=A0A1Z2XTN3_9FIRM|nr:nicotinate-nucleotide adenylyltransferase [Acutalibacter muris]ANU54953.1 nicotinate (nicotinamide) nucleotide adenylyltransferase [Hungateiclostridiaceae bacterium KB18]ASB41817.1 nicotinate (nicotinamide) nucleotide adenylyltransferase [Acutalibacter muris]QQR31084.1 nicotinate (nicotinamide) nucleotide adenylyltransferase [Acutalibacter muris]